MKKSRFLNFFIFFSFSIAAQAATDFYEKNQGQYTLKKGSLKQCSDGAFHKTHNLDENSYLLGTNIIFSNVDKNEITDPDPENENCNFKTKSKFVQNGLEQSTTTVCNGKIQSTRVEKLTALPNGELKYSAPEGDCVYTRTHESSKK